MIHTIGDSTCKDFPFTVWITGIPASGKTTLGNALAQRLRDAGVPVLRIDGDVLRSGLCSDLDLSPNGRAENIRRAGELAILAARSGITAIVSLVSPMRANRGAVRARHDVLKIPFLEVWMDTSLEICVQRDPKGLYTKAKRGEIKDLTGYDSPYEPPENPLIIKPDDIDSQVRLIMEKI